ncbi:zinc-binding dehydrogenase [Candidatus Poribacteria bacterium]|nr:zinc-binding dehydrogenase [Candidatus Poribacteria bacterium]
MKKAVCISRLKIDIQDAPIPVPAPRQVLIETKGCGLCTTDIYRISGKDPLSSFPNENIGHEPNGVVVEVGKEVTRFRPGDRVTTLWAVGGFTAFAEYYLQDEDLTFHLPDDIPFEFGLCEPLFAAAKGAICAGILPGDTVAVVGVGFFGQLLAQAARFQGAWKVAAFDKIERRLEIAKKHGVDAIYNVSGDGVQIALRELTNGNGFDTVIECAGVEGAFDTATELVRPGGTIYSYALHVQPEKINPQPWHWKGFRILNNNWMFPFTIPSERIKRLAEIGLDWVRRGFWSMDELITGITPLDDLEATVYTAIYHPEKIMKAVIGKSRG